MTITGEQVKAARELLGWTLLDLGFRADVSEATIAALERAQRTTRPDKVQAIQRALEAAGIEFITEQGGEPGAKLRRPE
jgi:transcriptional regulator with XRE-family HTH domain